MSTVHSSSNSYCIFQVQHEHKVVRQSAFSESVAHRKDNCLGRKDNSSFRPKSAPDGQYLHLDIETFSEKNILIC